MHSSTANYRQSLISEYTKRDICHLINCCSQPTKFNALNLTEKAIPCFQCSLD